MADTKFSELTAVATPAGTDEFGVNQGGTSKKETLAQVATFVTTAPVFAAGTASANTWPKFTSGTLLTTPEDGAIELDGNCFYGCTDVGNRGYIPVRHFIRTDSARTYTSSTSPQAMFNSPTNGRITLETGTYLFKGLLGFTALSTSAGNLAVDILGAGTATIGSWLWKMFGRANDSGAASSTCNAAWSIGSVSPASFIASGANDQLIGEIDGTFEVTGAGTIIPTITLVNATAAVLSIGSYLVIERIGSTSIVSVGQWD